MTPLDLVSFAREHALPDSFVEMATTHFVPLANWVRQRIAMHGSPAMVLGINGAQGTGKSTLADFLCRYLHEECACNAVALSIDDFYLSRAERAALADRVHPLLITRGVPGTHDVELGCRVIETLATLGHDDSTAIPVFDKSIDDRMPDSRWTRVVGPVDLVILEGWCVASLAEIPHSLSKPVNALEAGQDPDGAWRHYVNDQLANVYPQWYSKLDALVFLRAPDFDAIRRWRLEQERKLAVRAGRDSPGILSAAEIPAFVQYFERITRNNLRQIPDLADVIVELGVDHRVLVTHYRNHPH